MTSSRRVLLVVGFSSLVFASCVKKGGELRLDVSKNSVEVSWGPKEAQPCPPGFVRNQNGDCIQPVPPGPVNVSVSGTVYVFGSSRPVSGARIATSLDSQFSQTDPSGFFFLNTNAIGQGNYARKPFAVSITAEGYKGFSQSRIWGDNPSNQAFYLIPDEPFYYIPQIAAGLVEREYKDYLKKGPSQVPDLITGQGMRMQGLQKTWNQEWADLRAYDRDENQRFAQEQDKERNDYEKSISKKPEGEQANLWKQFNNIWNGKKAANVKRVQDEQCYLKRRQALESEQMKTMFAQEKIEQDSPEEDLTSQIESAWASYQAKHSSPEYVLASCKLEPPSVEGSLSLKIEPHEIMEGQSAELTWECWYCGKEVTILPEPGLMTGHRLKFSPPPEKREKGSFPQIGFGSSLKITPSESTQYKVSAKDWFGKDLESSAKIIVSRPLSPPQTIVRNFQWVGLTEDRVGKAKTAVSPDGQIDGEFDLTVEGPFDNLMIETARPGESGAQGIQKEVQVTANPLWTNSGLSVVKGQKVDITAQGNWSWGANVSVNGGSECCPWDAFEAFDGNDKGRLIAYIGADPFQGHWGQGNFFPRKQGYISVGSKQSFQAPETGKLWLGFNDDAVSKAVGDNSGSVKADVTLSGSEEVKPVPCCGQVWNTIARGPVTAAGAQWDASQIWVLGFAKHKGSETGKGDFGLMNRADGSILPWREQETTTFRLFAANSGYFHKGQNFILTLLRPDGQMVRAYTEIEAEPGAVVSTSPAPQTAGCPPNQVNHDPVQIRSFDIRTNCGKGEASYIANTSFSPPSLQANQGDTIHLTVFGPPYGENDFCYSVSVAIPVYGIYLPKIVRGTKQEATFVADKFGEFDYIDQERRIVPRPNDSAVSGRNPVNPLPPETRPGKLYICQNTPPAQAFGKDHFDNSASTRPVKAGE